MVSGKFVGDCECDTVEILPQGRIEGKVVTKEFVIERAGLFIGQSMLRGEEKSGIEQGYIENQKEIKKLDSK